MRKSKSKTTTPLESATQQDEIQPCERSFMLDVAEMDFVPREGVERRIQDERSGEAFGTILQSNNDAGENHDNDNINYSTNDSDSDHHNGRKNEQLKKKKRVGGGTRSNKLPNRVKTTKQHGNDTEENHSLHHEEPKLRAIARVWKFCRDLKSKKVRDGRSEVTPDFLQSPIVDENKTGEKGMNCNTKSPLKKDPNSTGREMNGVAERKRNARDPTISQSCVDAAKVVDNDNIESDEEFLYKMSRFRGGNDEVMEENAYMVFPHFDPTASGNARVYRVSKFRENIESYDHNAFKGGRVEMLRQERQAIRLTQQGKSASDSVPVRGPGMRDEKPLAADDHQTSDVPHDSSVPSMSGPINQSDPNFHTRTVYSVERNGEIISSHPETATINVISEMYVAPPSQSEESKLGSKLKKLVPERLRTISWTKDEPGLTQNTTERDTTNKATRKGSDESLRTLIGRIKGIMKKKVDYSEQQTDNTVQVLRQNGTKDLESQVSKITKSVPKSCTLSKSKSVKSVKLVIEGGSSEKVLVDNTKDILKCCQSLTPASGPSSSSGPSVQAVASSQNTLSESINLIHVCYMGEGNRSPRRRHIKFRPKQALRTRLLRRCLRIEDIRELRSQRMRRSREALRRSLNNGGPEASSARVREDKIQRKSKRR